MTDIIFKLIGSLIAVITCFRLMFKDVFHQKSRMREDYEFIKKYLSDISDTNKAHPYLIEKGFYAISGKDNLTAQEIIYLLSQPNPSQCLKRYADAKNRYLEYADSTKRINFKFRFSNQKKRYRAKVVNLVFYFIFSLLATTAITFFSNLYHFHRPMAFFFLFCSVFLFTPNAFLCGRDYKIIKEAEKLVGEQQSINAENIDLKTQGSKITMLKANGVLDLT